MFYGIMIGWLPWMSVAALTQADFIIQLAELRFSGIVSLSIINHSRHL